MHSVGSRSYNRYKSKWEECLQHQVSELNRVWQERGSRQGFPVKVPGGKQTWGGQTWCALAGNSETEGFLSPKTRWFPSVFLFSFFFPLVEKFAQADYMHFWSFAFSFPQFGASEFRLLLLDKSPVSLFNSDIKERQTQRNESDTRRERRRAVTLRDSARRSAAARRVNREHLASGDYILRYEHVKFSCLFFLLETYRQ